MSNICWTILTMKCKRREQREILKRSDKIIDTAESSSEARNCHECRCQRSVSFTGRSGEMRAEIRRYQERCCVIHKRRGGAWENPDEKLSLVMLIVNDSVVRKIERLYYPLTRKQNPRSCCQRRGKIVKHRRCGKWRWGIWPSWPPSSSWMCMIPIIMHGTKYLIFYI